MLRALIKHSIKVQFSVLGGPWPKTIVVLYVVGELRIGLICEVAFGALMRLLKNILTCQLPRMTSALETTIYDAVACRERRTRDFVVDQFRLGITQSSPSDLIGS